MCLVILGQVKGALTRLGSHEWLMYTKSELRFKCSSRPI
jgi:hypothetical protein